MTWQCTPHQYIEDLGSKEPGWASSDSVCCALQMQAGTQPAEVLVQATWPAVAAAVVLGVS
jgi:hypothetical protein